MVSNPVQKNDLTRRSVLGGMAATTLLTGTSAQALTTDQAADLITRMVADVNKVINSGRSANAMFGDFERIFKKYADVSAIARYALGADARSASRGQLNAFTKSFTGYISRKYGRRFREFIGGKIEVKQARPEKSYYVVDTTVILKGQSPFTVEFFVTDRSGKNLFYNMKIEGINLLLTERTEIGALLDKRKGNVDQLTADLKKLG